VKDAEAHAEEDKKAMELVTARNQCDQLVHSVQKMLKEHGEQLAADEKGKIEAALKEAEGALKSDNKDEIEAKSKTLAEASHKLAEKMYAAEAAKQQAAGVGAPGADAGGAGSQKADAGAKKDDGNVVDAEYTEVKDKK